MNEGASCVINTFKFGHFGGYLSDEKGMGRIIIDYEEDTDNLRYYFNFKAIFVDILKSACLFLSPNYLVTGTPDY
jgi:hypothetical protein